MTDVTHILSALEQGDRHAAEELLPLVYDELRKLAAAKMANEAPGQTLQATALVHEAYLRLVKSDSSQNFSGRGHFFAAAAEAMRRILVDNARRRKSQKRGGDRDRMDLDFADPEAPRLSEDVLALDEALEMLAQKDNVKAELVKLRYFAGLTMKECAAALNISIPTAQRYWTYARAWLHNEIQGK